MSNYEEREVMFLFHKSCPYRISLDSKVYIKGTHDYRYVPKRKRTSELMEFLTVFSVVINTPKCYYNKQRTKYWIYLKNKEDFETLKIALDKYITATDYVKEENIEFIKTNKVKTLVKDLPYKKYRYRISIIYSRIPSPERTKMRADILKFTEDNKKQCRKYLISEYSGSFYIEDDNILTAALLQFGTLDPTPEILEYVLENEIHDGKDSEEN